MRVIETCRYEAEFEVEPADADAFVAAYEAEPEFYSVRKWWDRVSFGVAVTARGESLPFVAWLVGHDQGGADT